MKAKEEEIITVEYPNLGTCQVTVRVVDSYTIETECVFNHRMTKGEGCNINDAIDHACRRMLSIMKMDANTRERFRHLYEIVF